MLEQITNADTALTLFFNGSHSLWLDGFALAITATMTWIPAAVVLLYVIIRQGETKDILVTILGIGLCILLADQTASGIFKPLVARFRPANEPSIMLVVDVVNDYRGGKYGFFSSHAANTFAVATFVALLIRHRLLTLTMGAWALLNCWSRVYLGVHYVGDILCGTICGIAVGFAVYFLFHRFLPQPRNHQGMMIGDVQTTTGYAISDAGILVLTLLLSFTYCCFKATFFN